MNGFLIVIGIVLLISSSTFAQETQILPQAPPQTETKGQQVVPPAQIQNQVATSIPAPAPIPVIVNVQAPVIPPPINVNERPNQSISKRFYFSFLVGYDTANEAKAPNSIVVTGADQVAGEYTFGTESAPLFGIELGEKTEYAMGWALGYSGSFERKIKSITFDSSSNSSPTTAAGTGQISLGSLYYDSIFYFKNSYIKFGLNYSFPGISGMANR